MPDFVVPPALTTAKFVLVVLVVQAMLLYAAYRTGSCPGSRRRRVAATAAGFVLVMAGTAALAESGFLAADLRRAFVYVTVTLLAALALGFGRPGAALAAAVAPVYWVLFQGFRLPLEIVLHAWAETGTIPVQMTWDGQNFDVVAGALALALGGAWLARPKATWLGVVAHGVGLALLLNVIRVAVLSLPTSFRAFDGPPLLLALHAPYTWIVPFAVGAALFGHIVGLRAIRQARVDYMSG